MRWLERIESLVDEFRAWDGAYGGVTAREPLAWPGYREARLDAAATSGTEESVVSGAAVLVADGERHPVAVVATVFEFIGGSMGLASGERIVRAYDRARAERLPVLLLACSGGARLQEGMAALVQMARAVDAARRHAEAGLLQVAYLDSPTTGGVYASIASFADVRWAAPGALIGFAGPRVVELTTGEPLPAGAHTAESALASGLVDAVLEPAAARAALVDLLAVIGRKPARSGAAVVPTSRVDVEATADPWAEVVAARAPTRPSGRTWATRLVPRAVELRGDLAGEVDPVVVTGLGSTAAGTPVAFVALDHSTADGRPRPAGYRTARRVIALAARLGLPLLNLVDTPGADPSDASERGGIAGEIARTMAAVLAHPAPTLALVVGEGGSGGALAFAATDTCYLLEGAVFEVISPEGAAAILERDATRAPEVAGRLGITPADLLELGIVDALLAGTTDAVADVLEGALATVEPGAGRARLDAATARWLHPES